MIDIFLSRKVYQFDQKIALILKRNRQNMQW